MKSLTEVNEKLTELHNALGQVIGFLGKAQEGVVSLTAAVEGILGKQPTVRVVRRKRKASMPVVAQPNGPDGAVQAAPTAEAWQAQPAAPRQATATRKGKGGWPKGMKRGPRKAKPVPDQEAAAA